MYVKRAIHQQQVIKKKVNVMSFSMMLMPRLFDI